MKLRIPFTMTNVVILFGSTESQAFKNAVRRCYKKG